MCTAHVERSVRPRNRESPGKNLAPAQLIAQSGAERKKLFLRISYIISEE